jgi:hypothetical protein
VSIRQFNKMLGPGCIGAVSVVTLIGLGGGLFSGMRGCGGPGQPNPQDQAKKPVIIATIGDFKIDANNIEARQQAELAQRPSDTVLTPEQLVGTYGLLLDKEVDLGLQLAVAKEHGITITEAEARKQAEQSLDQQLADLKRMLVQQGQLKPNFTDADFSKVFEQKTGRKASEIKPEQQKQLNAVLADPILKVHLLADTAQRILPTALAAQQHPTDDQLKASFVTITAKRVVCTQPNADEKMKRVQADLKAGMKFEDVIDKYTKDAAAGKKKVSEMNITLTHDQLAVGPLHSLLALKPGQMSDVLSIPEGKAIYRVDASKTELPKDFDKNKASYMERFKSSLANQQLQDDLDKLRNSGLAKFTDPGWGALYSFYELGRLNVSNADQVKGLREIVANAPGLLKDAKGDAKPAALAYYAAAKKLFDMVDGPERVKLEDDRIASIVAVEPYGPSPDDHVQLAAFYYKKKNPDGITQALLKAIEDNSISGGDAAENEAARISMFLSDLEHGKGISEAQAKSVKDAMIKWRADKKQRDDEQKAQEKAMLEEQAEQLKQQKAAEEAQKKAAKDGKSGSGTSSAPTPSAPGPSVTTGGVAPSVLGGPPSSPAPATAGGLGKGP